MKAKFFIFLFILACFSITAIAVSSFRQKGSEEPWTQKQLFEPADLARIMNDPKAKQPVVLCIGPGALIKGSAEIGPARDKKNLDKLKQQVSDLPRDAEVIIYCGCCPFEHCPNIRPAFTLLNDMKFTHHRLLNIPHNLKTDWIDKGYPTVK